MDTLDRLLELPPADVALDFGGEQLTYEGLVARASAFAAELRDRGLEDGARIALHLPHGLEAPAALFGCWLAGSVAVPLDPQLPAERIAAILHKAGASLLVAHGPRGAGLARRLGWEDRTLLASPPGGWEGDLADVWAREASPEPRRRRRDDPCLLLFTSGSTGEPKGVTIPVRAVDVFTAHWLDELELRRRDRVAWVAALSFDLSLFDLGVGLSSGATVVPVPEKLLAFPDQLAAWIKAEEITVWYSVPSLLVGMLRSGLCVPEPPGDLRVVLYAGEKMAARDAQDLVRALPWCRVWNLFGPTETNVNAAFELPDWFADDEVPIGGAMPYLDMRLWDGEGEAEAGEIVCRHGTTMLGYWEEPARADWVEIGGRRYLRTGDRARWREDGLLEFLGRADRMVKVSGYRVELEDVERHLLALPGVAEAAVIAEGEGVERRLVGFVSGEVNGDLRSQLALHVPRYAVPARIDVLDALPRNERGKIDLVGLGRR